LGNLQGSKCIDLERLAKRFNTGFEKRRAASILHDARVIDENVTTAELIGHKSYERLHARRSRNIELMEQNRQSVGYQCFTCSLALRRISTRKDDVNTGLRKQPARFESNSRGLHR
jgi:hypothetical protein